MFGLNEHVPRTASPWKRVSPARFILLRSCCPRQRPHAPPLSADLPRRGALPARRRRPAAPQPVPRQLLRGMFPEAGETGGGRRRGGERQLSRQPFMQQGQPACPLTRAGGRRPSPQAGCCQGNRQERLNWTATVRARPLVDALIRRSQHNSPLTPPSFLGLRHRSRVRLPLSWSERLQHFLSIKTTAQSPNRIVEP